MVISFHCERIITFVSLLRIDMILKAYSLLIKAQSTVALVIPLYNNAKVVFVAWVSFWSLVFPRLCTVRIVGCILMCFVGQNVNKIYILLIVIVLLMPTPNLLTCSPQHKLGGSLFIAIKRMSEQQC